MEDIASLLPKWVAVPEATKETQRGEQLKAFCARLNPGRAQFKLKALTISAMAKLLKDYGCRDAADMYIFFRKCEGFQVFSKGFWHLINDRKKQLKV